MISFFRKRPAIIVVQETTVKSNRKLGFPSQFARQVHRVANAEGEPTDKTTDRKQPNVEQLAPEA